MTIQYGHLQRFRSDGESKTSIPIGNLQLVQPLESIYGLQQSRCRLVCSWRSGCYSTRGKRNDTTAYPVSVDNGRIENRNIQFALKLIF